MGLNLYDFNARLYDPYTLRTPTLDPDAQFYPRMSPYSFLENNPVNMLDPTGMDAMGLNEGENLSGGGNQGGGMAICPNCPNTPEFDRERKDPNTFYVYDPKTGKATATASMLPEVTVTANKPQQSNALDLIMTLPQVEPFVIAGAGAVTTLALTVGFVFKTTDAGNQTEMDILAKTRAKYIPAPKTLKGFPGAQRARQKGGRARWRDSNGNILEWDSQHGDVEVYDKRGNHKGSADPETGQWTKPPVPGRPKIDP